LAVAVRRWRASNAAGPETTPEKLVLVPPPDRRSPGAKYITGLVVSSIMLPGIAGAITMTLLLIEHPFRISASPRRCFLFGTLIAVGVWLVCGWFFRRFGDASTADGAAYKDLASRTLAAWKKDTDGRATAALTLAGRALGLTPPGRPATGVEWASGTGYLAVTRLVHSAEEALIDQQTNDEAVCEALNAWLSLRGSKIPGAAKRTAQLEVAIRSLGGECLLPTARRPGRPRRGGLARRRLRRRLRVEDCKLTVPLAKAVIRNTRQTINEYRDGLRNELITIRTALFGSVLATGTMAYLLLGLGLLGGIEGRKEKGPVVAAVAFYVVGAVVGLFNRLHTGGRGGGRADDDVYVTTIRLIQTPLFSGLAAIGGVIVSSLATAGTKGTLSTLDDIFKVSVASIVTAAVFALTPNLLVNILVDRAKKSKQDLAASNPSQGGEAEPSTPATNAGTTG
jgi:hypothetical protein